MIEDRRDGPSRGVPDPDAGRPGSSLHAPWSPAGPAPRRGEPPANVYGTPRDPGLDPAHGRPLPREFVPPEAAAPAPFPAPSAAPPPEAEPDLLDGGRVRWTPDPQSSTGWRRATESGSAAEAGLFAPPRLDRVVDAPWGPAGADRTPPPFIPRQTARSADAPPGPPRATGSARVPRAPFAPPQAVRPAAVPGASFAPPQAVRPAAVPGASFAPPQAVRPAAVPEASFPPPRAGAGASYAAPQAGGPGAPFGPPRLAWSAPGAEVPFDPPRVDWAPAAGEWAPAAAETEFFGGPLIDLSAPRPLPVTHRGPRRRARALITVAAVGAVLAGVAGYAALRDLGPGSRARTDASLPFVNVVPPSGTSTPAGLPGGTGSAPPPDAGQKRASASAAAGRTTPATAATPPPGAPAATATRATPTATATTSDSPLAARLPTVAPLPPTLRFTAAFAVQPDGTGTYLATVTIANEGTVASSAWTVRVTVGAGARTVLLAGDVSAAVSGSDLVITPTSGASPIAVGGSLRFSFSVTAGAAPSGCQINGSACS